MSGGAQLIREARTPVQALAAELDLARALLRAERRMVKNLAQQLAYHRERHEYFKRLTVGYEVELRIRPAERERARREMRAA